METCCRIPQGRALLMSLVVLGSTMLFLYLNVADSWTPVQLAGVAVAAPVYSTNEGLQQRNPTTLTKMAPINVRKEGMHRTIPAQLTKKQFPVANINKTADAIMNNVIRASDSVNVTNRAPPDKREDNPRILMVVAYLRSGSTFTASLFAQQQDNFYVFEPLHQLAQHASAKSKMLYYINGTTRHIQAGFNDGTVFEAMDNWVACRFNEIDEASLMDEFHESRPTSMRLFVKCVKSKLSTLRLANKVSKVRGERKPSAAREETIAIKDCLHFIENRCLSANMRVFKSIRLKMSIAEKLLMKYPNLKIIHLVRDPRGMFNSQQKAKLLHGSYNSSMPETIKQFCKSINTDIDTTSKLLKSFPNRVKLLRYEDLAENPFPMLEDLYKFVGLKLTSSITSYVNKSTSLNLPDSCTYCTGRGNSSETAYKWRETIHTQLVQIVDQNCGEIYDKLGYDKLK